MREMGLVGGWEWVISSCGKKQGRSWVRRIRAALRNAIKNSSGGGGGGGRKCNFRYDPWSYALNFDDGARVGVVAKAGEGSYKDAAVRINGGEGKSGTWVYVLWVKVE